MPTRRDISIIIKFNNYDTNIPILSKSLDSREFKLILKPNLFKKFSSGIRHVQEVIDTEVKKLNGTYKFESDQYERSDLRRRVDSVIATLS
jgi:hypothetical protein